MRAEKLGLLRVVTVGMVGSDSSSSSSSSSLELESSLEDEVSLAEAMLVSPSFSLVLLFVTPFGLLLRRGKGALVSGVAVAAAMGSSLRGMVAQEFWYIAGKKGWAGSLDTSLLGENQIAPVRWYIFQEDLMFL